MSGSTPAVGTTHERTERAPLSVCGRVRVIVDVAFPKMLLLRARMRVVVVIEHWVVVLMTMRTCQVLPL